MNWIWIHPLPNALAVTAQSRAADDFTPGRCHEPFDAFLSHGCFFTTPSLPTIYKPKSSKMSLKMKKGIKTHQKSTNGSCAA